MTTGERILTLRKSHGFTQEDVAKYLNTTKQNIYKYEMGIVTNIPLDKVEQLAALFHVTPDYIVGWSDEALSPTDQSLLDAYHRAPISVQAAIVTLLEPYQIKAQEKTG